MIKLSPMDCKKHKKKKQLPYQNQMGLEISEKLSCKIVPKEDKGKFFGLI